MFQVGCEKTGFRLTHEQQVYEFVFNKIMQDANKEVLIQSTYKGISIDHNAIGNIMKRKDLKKFPTDLVIKVIKSTEKANELKWKPIMVNGKFIDVSLHESNANNKKKFWEMFRKTYPKHSGYFSVSKVILDKNGENAVLLFSYSCPVLCGGHSTFLHLKKKGVTWSLESAARLWVS